MLSGVTDKTGAVDWTVEIRAVDTLLYNIQIRCRLMDTQGLKWSNVSSEGTFSSRPTPQRL